MKIKKLELIDSFDRDTGSILVINGEPVASVNYDEHGSAGLDVLKQVHNNLAKKAGVFPHRDELDDNEFFKIKENL